MALRWRIYYGEGSRYDGETEADAMAAPVLNVQLVKQEADNPRGYTLRHGCNFFCWERAPAPRWSGKSDLFGLQDYYGYHEGAQKVLIGREIYDDAYQAICRRAVAEGSFDAMGFRPGKLVKG